MVRKMTLTFMLLVGCTWCATLVSNATSAGAAESAADTGFKPVASVPALMSGQVMLFKQIGKALQNQRMKNRSKRIANFAELLAELANLNILKGQKDDYRGWARDLRTTSLALSKEAGKRKNADEDKMAALVDRLKATCTACHDVYQDE